MYKALVRFADLKDGGRIYEAGDNYPRPGFSVSAERIAVLAGSDNAAGYPLIAKTAEPEETPHKAAERPVTAANDSTGEKPAQASKPAQKRRKSRRKE